MYKKLKRKTRNLNDFDPSVLDDPFAMQIDWTPLKRGGTNLRTHQLEKMNADRMEFRVALGAKIFCGSFIFIGLALVVAVPFYANSKFNPSLKYELLVPVFLGLGFAGAGACQLYFLKVPIVFDKQKGILWKGRNEPDEVFDREEFKFLVEFENVHALQLIFEASTDEAGNIQFYSYELNLVLKDGKRINLVDHGDVKKIREDAKTLSEFLDKPVWDAT